MYSKRSISLAMTIIIISCIISIVVIARWSLAVREDDRIINTYVDATHINDPNLNIFERNILIKLLRFIDVDSNRLKEDDRMQTTYFIYLKNHLCDPMVNLNPDTVNLIEEQMKGATDLMKLENINEFKEMSYDGREVAIRILQKIYELCGLNIQLDSKGDVKVISNLSGEILYQESNLIQQPYFHFDALLIILTIISVLFLICYMIAKKNQLFIKGGDFNGLDEKGIA